MSHPPPADARQAQAQEAELEPEPPVSWGARPALLMLLARPALLVLLAPQALLVLLLALVVRPPYWPPCWPCSPRPPDDLRWAIVGLSPNSGVGDSWTIAHQGKAYYRYLICIDT